MEQAAGCRQAVDRSGRTRPGVRRTSSSHGRSGADPGHLQPGRGHRGRTESARLQDVACWQ
ncbi:phage DNA packaging protein J [Reyranella sp. CPCC 100927]|uniref:phage DNA packaging protein J n=1 Tax=Reyranella sp. CPCC 100927 TaxID=2599616 RepID=UPI00351A61F9